MALFIEKGKAKEMTMEEHFKEFDKEIGELSFLED